MTADFHQGSGTASDPTGAPAFRNPLYPHPFADPFVLKFNGGYYAYGTPKSGGLPVLRSCDMVTWEDAGEVLPAAAGGLQHWAPEVAYDNGRFYLYYSTGGREGENHRLRVATGPSPTGPFDEELGLLDPDDPFTIDAHPFQDDDGRWYLFYSRDFLDGEPVGTGIVVDRLVDMTSLAGERATVMRPHAEWHLYERQRRWYDRVWDWYTVEGPFVRKHDGRYWCFYSGGAWKEENYGISSAVADDPMGPYEPVQAAHTADVLRTVSGRVIGPGHGSVAVAPDNVTEYLVYHAWDLDRTGRFLHVDRLGWDEERPVSPGPCTDPQPCPPQPLFGDLVPGAATRPDPCRWELHGPWRFSGDRLVHPGGSDDGTALAKVAVPRFFVLEVNLTMAGDGPPGGSSGVVLSHQEGGDHTAVLLEPERGQLRWEAVQAGSVVASGELAKLRGDFAAGALHQLMVHADGEQATVMVDGVRMGRVPLPPSSRRRVGVVTSHLGVAVSGVALTERGAGAPPTIG